MSDIFGIVWRGLCVHWADELWVEFVWFESLIWNLLLRKFGLDDGIHFNVIWVGMHGIIVVVYCMVFGVWVLVFFEKENFIY